MTEPGAAVPSRDEIATRFLDQLPFAPYPLQEEALLAWFSSEQGVMVCAPTGTGKTVIAEAALFEALHNGTVAYYTTPLIALTEQKFREMQGLAVKWGFDPREVGLVTGNRRENPTARILVVVAEILFNRLLHGEAFDFSNVSAVVMDEFHSFNDPERGVVWELSLGLLPPHVRTLLLSATVGNAMEFMHWLRAGHHRTLEVIQGQERKVPLVFQWIPDMLLTEQIESMAEGSDEARTTPALVFCFNRDECWNVAEQIKGKNLLLPGQQAVLDKELKHYDWSQGAGPKLRQLLLRGVGVHHAGVLPKYRRIVEELFQKKLLSVAICTETLSAGINLPARSVVVPNLMKGPPGKKRVIESSSAHQIFGRAGRPQFDSRGYVFVLAHEDDVKITRWKEKYDQIPEDTKDPGLLKAKKSMKRKQPKRRDTEQYWTEAQFDKLRDAQPGKLYSKGPLPWRLLSYMLAASPEVALLRKIVGKRLMDGPRLEQGQRDLDQMLLTLWRGGYITLDPQPPAELGSGTPVSTVTPIVRPAAPSLVVSPTAAPAATVDTWALLQQELLGTGTPVSSPVPAGPPAPLQAARVPPADEPSNASKAGAVQANDGAAKDVHAGSASSPTPLPKLQLGTSRGAAVPSASRAGSPASPAAENEEAPPPYRPERAYPTPEMAKLMLLRGVNPLYGVFLVNQLGIANREERIQAIESVLELPRSVGYYVRVPRQDRLPRGPLATERLDEQLLRLGLVTADELTMQSEDEEEERRRSSFDEPPKRVLALAEKLRLLFDFDFPRVHSLFTSPVWAAGEVLEFGGDFNKYVTSKSLQKQEGVIFRHLLRLILLVGELTQLCPPDVTQESWRGDLEDIAARLTEACRQVDPTSTEKALEAAAATGDEEMEPGV